MLDALRAGADLALLPDSLTLGAVTLRSRDPERLLPFYRDALGLAVLSHSADHLVLGAGGRALVEIVRALDAPIPPARAPGLFHLAIRVPDRAALADRLVAIHRFGGRLGASDHLVSEALYVDDPDGNGIEIYRDRPRSDWPRNPDNSIAMATLPLDLSALLREAAAAPASAPDGTDMGHVHLKVGDLDAARHFWVDLVGFEVMARYPGALFVSAGGYHHHLGLNAWQSGGSAPPPKGACGLDAFAVTVPEGDLDALAARLSAAGWPYTRAGASLTVADPSGNTAVFSAGTAG